MLKRKNFAYGLALLVSAAMPFRCLAGTFSFDYSLAPPPNTPGFVAVAASGTLMADLDSGTGIYVISSIAGNFSIGAAETQITGLIPPGGFFNSNLLFYPNQPLLDSNGLSFTIADPTLSDDGSGDVNIFFDPSLLYLDFNPNPAVFYGNGTFSVSPVSLSNPEPASAMLLIGGLLAVAGRIKWRRRSSRERTTPLGLRRYNKERP